MIVATNLVGQSSVILRCCREYKSVGFCGLNHFQFDKWPGKLNQQSSKSFQPLKCAQTGAGNHHHVSYEHKFKKGFKNEYKDEPFWLGLLRDVAWSLRSLTMFLAEQPSQLKYIEWPTFQITFKTATLTLVLVALLIVALSSIDSCLSYILASLLRKSA